MLKASVLLMLALQASAAQPPVPPAAPSPATRASPATPLNLTAAAAAALQTFRTACAADFKTYCPNTAPGSAEASQCFQTHYDALTPDCQGAIIGLISSGVVNGL